MIKFLLNIGVGSPGKTSKLYCDRYAYFLSKTGNYKDAIEEVLNERILVAEQINNTEAKFYFVGDSEKENLAFFIFTMMFLETKTFRDSVANYNKLLKATCELIYENVIRRFPNSMKWDKDVFTNVCRNYVSRMYRFANL